MSDIFDLDAIANEANGSVFTFKFRGTEYTMETGEDCDWRVIEALDKGDLATAMRYLLGDEQYVLFSAQKVTARALKALLERWSKFRGDPVGEASASPAS